MCKCLCIIGCMLIAEMPLLAQTYHLVWADEFSKKGPPDSDKWMFSPWHKLCENNDKVSFVKNGTLVLKAIKDTSKKGEKYCAGCIETRSKMDFFYGKILVRAKFTGGRGSWPAIWLKPVNPKLRGYWPKCGELDIMEHYNNDSVVYHTIHSYNRSVNKRGVPGWTAKASINLDKYNVYGMIWGRDSIIMTVNGDITFTYPRIDSMGVNEWPYDVPFFLLLNMTLNEKPGLIRDDDLPFEMKVDWVRYYEETSTGKVLKHK
jgi:beta-glucanase (GH16 family)